jgi:hypothetical protein
MFVEEFMNNKKCCNYHHHHRHSYGHNYQRTTAYLQQDNNTDSRASKDNDHGKDTTSILRNQNQKQNHDEIGSMSMDKDETNLVQIKRHVCSLAHQQIEHTVS